MATIFVIEDEEGIRDLLDLLLRRKRYDGPVAERGQKSLELFRREYPDVVVLDLKMPGMDGLAVLQQVRSLNPSQPVIILTWAGTAETEQQVRALGVTEGVIWTTEKPTVPGWYWYQASADEKDPAMAYVYEFWGHMNAVWSNGKSVHVVEMPGQWAGPLTPPER